MRKVLLILVLVLLAGTQMAHAASYVDTFKRQYDRRGFEGRDDWLTVFNNVASEASLLSMYICGEKEIRNNSTWDVSNYRLSFDFTCDEYRALLDIGVERGFIDDAVRLQQINKLMVLSKKVSDYLTKSSGLGL